MVSRKMLPKVLQILNAKNIVLASGSPRRLELLQKVGLKINLVPSKFEENLNFSDYANYAEFVEATALGKVEEVEHRLQQSGQPADIIIGADTMVTQDGIMYGKPKNDEEAFQTLKKLSGKTHVVYTGVTLKMGTKMVQFTENTKVFFGELTDEDIWSYIATREPMDKAGAYGIQGVGSILVRKIEGDFFTVLGLPLYRLNQELTNLIS